MPLKLKQGQIWKQGDQFIRIVQLERLEVGYKTFTDLRTKEGAHHHTSKKDFCRLLKSATLLGDGAPPAESPPPAPPA